MYQKFRKIRQAVMEWFTLKIYFPIVFKVYKPNHAAMGRDELLQMPQGSLGRGLLNFIDSKGLDLIDFYELHDAKHLLLDYDIGFEDEIQMQYFELGNGNSSLPVWLVIILGTLLAPDFMPKYIKAYQRGKNCKPITETALLKGMSTEVSQLKKQLNIL